MGTGLSDELRERIAENPEQWIGRVARIVANDQYPSGAFRGPRLASVHEDYGPGQWGPEIEARMGKEAGIEVAEPRHPALRPVSSTVGRLPGALTKGLLLHRPDLPFRKWTEERKGKQREVARQMEKAFGLEDSDVLLSLGSTRPLRNLARVWKRKDLSLPGRLLGTAASPVNDLISTLTRGDNYNPFANTATIFDPEDRITRHELGHATDFESRRFKTPYMLGYSYLPGFKLYPEHRANQLAEASLPDDATEEDKEHLRDMLRRSFGSYMGGEPAKYLAPALTNVAAIAGSAINRAVGSQKYEMSDKQLQSVIEKIRERRKAREGKGALKHLAGIA